ncbi:MAG: bifunctional enoyl-CoA hydratase/phosphate acetyltransferase [Chloroflexi bacterium]|nr:bifunctional enoyl-CoA hydratase/phosphate acetyltransferase [Chloroflexota bacterium]
MLITNFAELIEAAQAVGPKHIAIAAAYDPAVLISAEELQKLGITVAHLVGDRPAIEDLAQEYQIDLSGMIVVHEPDTGRAAQQAVAMARQGQADVVIKGQLKTSEMLGAALDRERGIRERKLLTHVGLFEVPGFDRLIYMSDSGVVLSPTIEQKLIIIQNVVEVAHKFGLERPRVAILSATDVVHPRIPHSIEALALAKMAAQGWVEGAIVDGPLTLDVAVSLEAARIKGVESPVAGQADILIVPGVVAGNTAAKAIQYLAGGRMAGLVVGAKVPIIINSRADTADTRLLSTAMAVVLAASSQPRQSVV